jgi:hypothetical protein
MNTSKLTQLRQIMIPKPCSESWEDMSGDEQKRFCAGCGCHVHNISAMKASDAEQLLQSEEPVCTKIKVDEHNRVLTLDGWIPRLMLAGALTATAAVAAAQTEAGHRLGQRQRIEDKPKHVKPADTKKETEKKKPLPEIKQYVMGRYVLHPKPVSATTEPKSKDKQGKDKKPKKKTT